MQLKIILTLEVKKFGLAYLIPKLDKFLLFDDFLD